MKNDIKLGLLVGLLVVSLAWGTGSVLSVPSKYVHNLDTGEYFLTIGHALLDQDTLPGHTIKLEDGYNTITETLMTPFQIQKDVIIEGIPGIQEFAMFSLTYSDYLTFKYIDSGNVLLFTPQPPQPTAFRYVYGILLDNLHNNLFQNIVTSNVSLNIQTEAPNTIAHAISHGIELQDSKYNTLQYLGVADISSTANASASSSTASATAVSRADGIYLDDSADNTFQYIDIEEINSAANASASSVFSYATADSYAYGLELDESDGNIFQDIDIENVTSQANAEAISASRADAEADSRAYGIHLSESNYNTFQYIGITGISSTARAGASSPGSADAEADSRAYGLDLDDSNYNIFRYIDIENISSDATASAVDSSGITLAMAASAAYGISLERANDNIFQYSSITDTGVGILNGSSSMGTKINYSSLSGNTIYGIQNNNPNYDMDATLNWWGDDSGPAHLTNPGGIGDSVSDNVIYSPWLADSLTGSTGIDTDPDTHGVQFPENVHIIVDDVGPTPTTEDGYEGYLNQAIWGANDLPGEDTIIVNHGTYTANQPITEGVEIVSILGSPANTFIKGGLKINSPNVTLGKRVNDYISRGFTINGNITVGGGVDASSIHINWNNILGNVTNNGSGLLDATYNWWGNTHPDDSTVGSVDYTPYLPTKVATVLNYMKTRSISDPQAAIAGMICGSGSSSEQAVCKLSGMGLNPDQANGLLGQFGLSRVSNAIKNGKTTSKFMELLGGYSLPGGGAAGLTNNLVSGGAGSVGGKTVGAVFPKGETVEVGFPLSDFEGNPAVDINPTVSLVLMDGDGKLDNLVDVTTAIYDAPSSAYVANFESFGLAPGYYLVQVDLPDISSLSQVIQVEGEEA